MKTFDDWLPQLSFQVEIVGAGSRALRRALGLKRARNGHSVSPGNTTLSESQSGLGNVRFGSDAFGASRPIAGLKAFRLLGLMIATAPGNPRAFRRTVLAVALLNLSYFGIEFAVARHIGSLSLFADSVDFLEDASVNLLIAIAAGWSLRARSQTGMALAFILLAPALATLLTLWMKVHSLSAPDPLSLTGTGVGALVVNVSCAFLLVRFRHHSGSMSKAAFLSARNDAFANIAIIAAGIVTAFVWRSGWPDVIVGVGIAIMNADAAREVWKAAREEHASAKS
ncbi:hypothetical protein BH10PSE2_BH10PSE2_04640 [soil metagenome]